jgi:hypothetical protein
VVLRIVLFKSGVCGDGDGLSGVGIGNSPA